MEISDLMNDRTVDQPTAKVDVAMKIITGVPTTEQISAVPSPSTKSTKTSVDNNNDKVKVHFVPVGSAPILKRTKYLINGDERFISIHVFLRKLLRLNSTSNSAINSATGSINNVANNLFLYCHSAFVPSPEHLISELRDSFAIRDELVIHYSIQEAWG